MSAIGGIFAIKKSVIQPQLLQKMADAIKNRGGDKEDQWISGHAGLFSKLLWTTPESQKEDLPLHNQANGLVLTADARIDNRQELVDQLGIKKRDGVYTDSELILQAYLKWGAGCTQYLIGDFAIAIWNEQTQTLFCARDHLGIKPFYYCINNEYFVFASQMEAVQIGAQLQKKPNSSFIKQFFEYKILACLDTIFEKVQRLLPGHTLSYRNGKIVTERYWFPEEIPLNKAISSEEAVEGFLSVMNRAITDRMRSAYPVGCEVSGGLDSSTVLALANDISSQQQPLLAFANTYGNMSCDESVYIKDVTDKLSIEPVLTRADKLDYGKYNLDYFHTISTDWPGKGVFLDAFGEYEAAKDRKVRVMLTGQGSDAMTAGYYELLSDYLAHGHFVRLFSFLKNSGSIRSLVKNYLILPFLPDKFIRLIYRLLGKQYEHNDQAHYVFCPNKSTIFHSLAQKKELEILFCPTTLLWMESNPHALLGEYYDIEVRHPFFDKRVVEFLLALPPWYKFDGKKQKVIIRESMRNKLPQSILGRDDKAEFTPVLLRQMEIFGGRDFESGAFASIITRKDLIELKKSLLNHSLTHSESNELWKIYCLDSWFTVNFGDSKGSNTI